MLSAFTLSAVTSAGLAISAIWIPGLLINLCFGFDRWRSLVFAPLTSIAVIAIAGIGGKIINLNFGWLLIFYMIIFLGGGDTCMSYIPWSVFQTKTR